MRGHAGTRWKQRLVLSCSVIALETEDIAAAGSAYFATPLSLSRLGLPARQCNSEQKQGCCVHGVYEGMWAAITFRHRPPTLFSYGMNEIRDGLLAVQCDLHERIIGTVFDRRWIAESRRLSTGNGTLAATIL